jgi:hypothetical protein
VRGTAAEVEPFQALDSVWPIVTLGHTPQQAAEGNAMQKKRTKRTARSHTVRVSRECHRCICLVSKGLDRPKSWVVENAIAEYSIIRDLDEQAKLRRPKLEVRA